MIDDYTGLVEKLRKDMRKTMKPSRYQHSERTADTARKLCEMYDLDTDKGFLAGLAHDICKDYDDKAIMALVKKDGLPIDSIEKKHNNTLLFKVQPTDVGAMLEYDSQAAWERVRDEIVAKLLPSK